MQYSAGKDEMHVLRNPHGFSEDVQRAARLWAADEIERLEKSQWGGMEKLAQQRNAALEEVEQLRAALIDISIAETLSRAHQLAIQACKPSSAGGYVGTKCDGNHGGPRCPDPECWNQ
jgi:hypothetical protein